MVRRRGCLSEVLQEHLIHNGGCHLLAAQMEDEWRMGRNLLLPRRTLLFLHSPPLTAMLLPLLFEPVH